MPYDYTQVGTSEGHGQIRVAFDSASPRCATDWRLADSEAPGPWHKVQKQGSAVAVPAPATVYLLQFRAAHEIPPENRTVTILEKQWLNLKIRYSNPKAK